MKTNYVAHMEAKELLSSLPDESVHAVVTDIPYGIGADDWDVLHTNTNSAYLGQSPAQIRLGSIFKKRGKPLNGWSESDRAIPIQYYEWCMGWAPQIFRVLKPGASVIIFAGRRLSHRCACALEDVGFTFKDSLAWIRNRAPHRAQRMSIVFERRGDREMAASADGWRLGNLRPIFEPVLWFTKPYAIGTTIADNMKHYGVGGYNEEAFRRYVKSPDNVLDIALESEEFRLHPTQKSVLLMSALIELVTARGQLVVDPFCGSGSTLIAARRCGRKFIGCDMNGEYCQTAQARLGSELL